MKLQTLIDAVMVVAMVIAVFAIALATVGCVSVNLFGGRTNQTVVLGSGLAESALQAETSIEDAIKDLLDQPDYSTKDIVDKITPPPLPPEPPQQPDYQAPTPDPFPDAPDGKVEVDGVLVPKPSSDEPLGEGTPGWLERNQALWKSKSEHGGNLVILLPISQEPKEVIIYAASPDHSSVIELGRTKSFTRNGKNGNRTHWRFPKSGGSYKKAGHDTKLKVYMQDGSTLWYDVLNPSQRHQMVVSRHQDAPR